MENTVTWSPPRNRCTFSFTVSMSRCCGPKVERRPPNRWLPTPTWASQVAALRKLGTRAPGPHSCCRNSLERFWQVVTSKMLSSPFSVRFHLMSVATPDAAGSTSAFQQLGGASTMCILSLFKHNSWQLLWIYSIDLVCWNGMPNSSNSNCWVLLCLFKKHQEHMFLIFNW